MSRSIISVLTITQCEFIIKNADKFPNVNKKAINAQIISLKQQKGMRKLTKLLSDPSNVIEKKVLYAALIRQRKVVFDNKILSLTDDIIHVQRDKFFNPGIKKHPPNSGGSAPRTPLNIKKITSNL